MEKLINFNDITISDNHVVTDSHAALQEYLYFPRAATYLRSLGLEVSFGLLKRYLDERKINAYVWLSSTFPYITVFPAIGSEFESQINNNELVLAVQPGFIKADVYSFHFTENSESIVRKNGTGINISISIEVAKSIVSDSLAGVSVLSYWAPFDEPICSVPFLKVSELNELAKNAVDAAREIESIRHSAIAPSRSELQERLKQLEAENTQLKDLLANAPTTNATHVAVGALIELLTEQKAPRRNQSRIKDELEEKGLKGLSRGSLNDIFSAANKALKASKDGA